MKFLLIAIAVLGLIYMVFIASKKPEDKPDRPKALYQKEVEKAKAVEILLQDTVERRLNNKGLNEIDQAR